MKFNSIKFEIGVLYTIILGVILVIFSSVLYVILSYVLFNQMDLDLKLKAREILRTMQSYVDIMGKDDNALLVAAQKSIVLETSQPISFIKQMKIKSVHNYWRQRFADLDFGENYIHFVSPQGTTVVRSKNLPPSLAQAFLKEVTGQESLKNVEFKKRGMRLVNMPFYYQEGKPYIIQIAASKKPITYLLHNWLTSIAMSIPLILIFAGFVGQIFAARILKPVQEIITTANKISYGDLTSRVHTKHFYIEVQALVQAFNDMIFRLEKSFKHIEEFSYHVAHELKTPITIVKGESELTLMKERSVREYQRVIRVVLEESERMLKTVEDLLLITKLDYQPGIFKFEVIDFMEFITEIFEQSKLLATAKNIRIHAKIPEDPVIVKADRLHLRRLFFNLIDNALKFTPSKGEIFIRVQKEGKTIVTEVSDTGLGISQQDLPKIFTRFFRSDNSFPGTGLGLNIAQVIAKIHHGQIAVDSEVGRGTTFTVTLPTET